MKRYLFGNVANLQVPVSMALVHNHVRPSRRLGTRGFRAWVQEPDRLTLCVCECGWAPELGQHFRTRARCPCEICRVVRRVRALLRRNAALGEWSVSA